MSRTEPATLSLCLHVDADSVTFHKNGETAQKITDADDAYYFAFTACTGGKNVSIVEIKRKNISRLRDEIKAPVWGRSLSTFFFLNATTAILEISERPVTRRAKGGELRLYCLQRL